MTQYFSGGSTLNGTPGGDRWVRLLCGLISRLSEPLQRFDAGCSWSTNQFENANSWQARKNPVRPKTHHETHIHPTTAITSRRRAKTHAPRVGLHSPASIDPEFVEIGHVQLSQSVKTTNVTHRQAHRQTDRQTTNGTLVRTPV